MAIDEEKIRTWLMEEDIIREKIYDENANFHYIINFPNDNAMDIIQPKTKEDVLLIGCATEVSKEEQNIIKNSSKSTNQEFIWKIRFTLNEMLLDFKLEHPNDELKSFIITEDIFEDGLTKHLLIKSIKKVFKGKLECIWILGKTYGSNQLKNISDEEFQL
ncbi:DUF2299 domain-containing protein [Methanobrevibacter olleyae]|uniref:DUF2299 domain-containing protein n=1 Tax=Methanobrevibacter olleyae TaxID=294671 RepID=A0A126R296_METOL|nr:DUF2299 domain-containing protein [Methanobrevibacter olleyae]AMK16166.1 hypothetical protein YLM1_1611 [Methanobrevibacter olleyae]SFL31643.1 hypothetical protein SAMN02910297_00543 [Methanobrevibacter olleyae]